VLYSLFFLHPPASKNIYPKEKTEKKKATKRYGHCGRPKGNGIIGGVPFRGGNRLCRSLLAGDAAGVHNTLAAFLSFFVLESVLVCGFYLYSAHQYINNKILVQVTQPDK
jgi:hypothetical protein